MSSAYFIASERPVTAVDTFVNGKTVARLADELDILATDLGIRPLSSFISISPDSVASFLKGEGIDPGGHELPPAVWFDPGEGLTVITALREHIEDQPFVIPSSADLLSDLQEYEQVLSALAQHNVRWHLEVDF